MTSEDIDRSINELWKLFKETDTQFKEIALSFKETDSRFKETDTKFKETDKEINKLSKEIKEAKDLFVSQWGRLVEALVEPGALRVLQERGMKVTTSTQRIKIHRNGDTMEIDILLSDSASKEVVFVEVKTTLRVEDVRDAVERIKKFKDFMPVYRECRVYGAVAAINMDEGSDRYAYKEGLFVIKAGTEGLIRILNDEKFRPRDFG